MTISSIADRAPSEHMVGSPGLRGNRPQHAVTAPQRAGRNDRVMPSIPCFTLRAGRLHPELARLIAAALVVLPAGHSVARADVFEVRGDGLMLMRSGAGAETPVTRADGGEAIDAEPAVLAIAPDLPTGAVTEIGAPSTPMLYRSAVLDAAARYQVSADLLAALVWQESRWQPAALSTKGAVGLAQLMPATARALSVDPHDAAGNLSGAAHYLRQMLDLFDGDVERALAAYNAGPERVLKAGGVPPIAETRAYVARIIDRLALIRATANTGVQP